jgi:Na+-transporting NADH:ubiquinone oxidoreductase subunit D
MDYQIIPGAAYKAGYFNNGLAILPPMALIVVGVIIWIQRSKNRKLIENN